MPLIVTNSSSSFGEDSLNRFHHSTRKLNEEGHEEDEAPGEENHPQEP
jgi:hypothetical protein